jgi:hypothetical protein
VAATDDPLPVLDDSGATVGVIDRRRVLAAMAGEPGPRPDSAAPIDALPLDVPPVVIGP